MGRDLNRKETEKGEGDAPPTQPEMAQPVGAPWAQEPSPPIIDKKIKIATLNCHGLASCYKRETIDGWGVKK